jgi:hypothetical protein
VEFILNLMLQESVSKVEINSPNGIDLTLTVHASNSSKSCILRPKTANERVLGKLADAYSRRQTVQSTAGQEATPITPVELTAYVIHRDGRWRGAKEAYSTGELARQIIMAIS